MVSGLNPRADDDATNPSTHAAWNDSGSSGLAAAALPGITRKPEWWSPAGHSPAARSTMMGGTKQRR